MSNLIRPATDPNPDLTRAGAVYTVSQLVRYFAAGLPPASNYPRHAKAYLRYCLAHQFLPDDFSLSVYAAGFPPNRLSPLRKFLAFYRALGQPALLPDPAARRLPPAANELVLRFIREAGHLRGERSKETYTKALNAFFLYADGSPHDGRPTRLGGLAVADYVQHLKDRGYSAFTVNLYLSALKQLAAWCIRRRDDLGLTTPQLDALRDIADIRGLPVERTFYKDSLSPDERGRLLAGADHPRDRALLALLALEGLRTVEVTRLRLGDLDFDRQQLLVLGKGKHTRRPIRFFTACQEMVRAFLAETGRWPIAASRHQEALFENLKTHQIRYVVDKHLRQHGLKRPGLSAHSLRHTAGQLLLEAGVRLEHVQQHLRHETLETTQFYTKKYTHRTYFEQMPD